MMEKLSGAYCQGILSLRNAAVLLTLEVLGEPLREYTSAATLST